MGLSADCEIRATVAVDDVAAAELPGLLPADEIKAVAAPESTGRVVFVNRYFFPDISASSQILSDLAFELARSGLEVHVIGSRLRYEGGCSAGNGKEEIGGVAVHRVWTSQFGRANLFGRAVDYFSFYCAMLWVGMRIVKPGDILVAKTDPPLVSVVCMLIAMNRRATLINWVQDLFPEVAAASGFRMAGGALGRLLTWMRNRSLRRAAANVVIGCRMKERLIRERLHPADIQVISNWADGEAIVPVAPEENTLRRAWGLDGLFVVGYSGNLGFAHDYQTLLEAADLLRTESRICFLFVGGGKHRPTLELEAQRRGLTNMRFMPYQPRGMLRYSLGIPDVHVVSLLPSLEGLIVPSKFYGVAAAGRGTLNIGSAEGEIARLLEEAGCGVTVQPGDSRGVVELLLRWRENPAEAMAMGERARALFDAKLSHHLMIGQWKAVLAEARARRKEGHSHDRVR